MAKLRLTVTARLTAVDNESDDVEAIRTFDLEGDTNFVIGIKAQTSTNEDDDVAPYGVIISNDLFAEENLADEETDDEADEPMIASNQASWGARNPHP